MKEILLNKIDQKDFVVGVIGLGYVGLPLLFAFTEKGFRTIGFDVDEEKVQQLEQGRSYIKHLTAERVQQAFGDGIAEATTDFSRLTECDGILIAVPTPLTANREPDMSMVENTADVISLYLRPGQLIVLESTTYPGTTDEMLIPILEKSGLEHGRDFLVAYSPEREDPNNKEFNYSMIPKVVGGDTEEALTVTEKLYQHIVTQTVPVSSTRVAEATKLMENIFRAVNIALINELKIAFMKMNIDIWEVIEAAKTKPFGYMPFYPGPGLGGHCIPIDPFYFTWKAREYGIFTRFIELAGEINTSMPDFVVMRVMEALSEQDKPLKGAQILLLGLAYKGNVDDVRESPSFYLMDKLERRGAKVSYNDPYIEIIPHTRKFDQYAGKKSVEINADYDLMLIVTAHDAYREIDFARFGIPVVDTRNILRDQAPLFYKA